MEPEEKFWLGVIGIIAASVVAISTICNYQQNLHYLDMVRGGYIQTTVPGYQGLVWQKK